MIRPQHYLETLGTIDAIPYRTRIKSYSIDNSSVERLTAYNPELSFLMDSLVCKVFVLPSLQHGQTHQLCLKDHTITS